MVEFALVAPILFALVFGVIDFGLVLSDDIGLKQGVREAARQGSVAQFGSRTSCSASLGGSATTEMQKLVCLTKARSDMPDSQVRVAIRFATADGSAVSSDAYPAGEGSPPVGNALLVCATAPMQSRTGFYGPIMSGRHMRSKVVMRIEVAAGTEQRPVQEVDPSGDGWSWCTP